jgi:hypothetical protein
MIEFDQTLADRVCELIADGYSLRKIEATPGMPTRRDVLRWLRESEAFQTQYAHSRDEQADAFAEEIIEISDDEATSPESRRVRIDARKWTAGKLRPKKYGDKTLLTGPDGNKPAIITLNLGGMNGGEDV